MNFRVNCACGDGVVVTERSAGARVTCVCGQEVRVPALHELRVSVGLPPYPISPEMEIEHLLGTNAFPRLDRCTRCEIETDDTIQIVVAFGEQQASRFSQNDRVVFVLLFGWIGALLSRGSETTGFDKVYHLPLHVCPTCKGKVKWASQIKDCMRKVEVYDRLLEKHPYATLKRT